MAEPKYKNPYFLHNVYAYYPKIDQTYRFDQAIGDKGQSIPCGPREDNAAYELKVRMEKKDAVALFKAMKKVYEAAKKKGWKPMPHSSDVFEVDNDGMYKVRTRLKGAYGGELVTPPAQYDTDNNLLGKDFLLTTGSLINVGVSLYPYSTATSNGVSLRLKEVQVVKLEPMRPRARPSSFTVIEGFKASDGYDTGFVDDDEEQDNKASDGLSGASEDTSNDFGDAPELSVVPTVPKPEPEALAAEDVDDIKKGLANLSFDD